MQENTLETGLELEEITLYKNFISNLTKGIKFMLDWMKNENEPEEKLKESVDMLFTAGQQIIELVNRITNDWSFCKFKEHNAHEDPNDPHRSPSLVQALGVITEGLIMSFV